jgi:hypothetical protein
LLRDILQQVELLRNTDADTICAAISQLQRIFRENPGQEMLLITNHGLLPLVTLLERPGFVFRFV